MSWGTKIAIAYGSFVVMILFFLFVASKQTNDLVEDHYYEKELEYQGLLDAGRNLEHLQVKPALLYEEAQLRITIPDGLFDQLNSGKIEFIRMSDSKADIRIDFNVDSKGSFVIPRSMFEPGLYRLRINWKNRDIPYLHHENFYYSRS